MAVNKHKPHLILFLEDKPYRDLVNGAKILLHVDDSLLQVKNPCGGYKKVFDELKEHLNFIDGNYNAHALLLIDFDNQHNKRLNTFKEMLTDKSCKDRVFLLGIDAKESEDLKKYLNITNYEEIASILLEKCPDESTEVWQSEHLKCNVSEIERMKKNGVFEWLFKRNN